MNEKDIYLILCCFVFVIYLIFRQKKEKKLEKERVDKDKTFK